MSRRAGAPDAGRINMAGRRYGRLKILKPSHTKGKTLYWKCVCDCGAKVVKVGSEIRCGNTRSCGCFR